MKVKDILTDEGKWTTKWMARDKQGAFAEALSDDAVCWCLLGAINKAYPDYNKRCEVKDKVYESLFAKYGTVTAGLWNDTHSFPEVRALIEELDI